MKYRLVLLDGQHILILRIRYDDIMVDDDGEEDNDDHSNINYDDIIVDDEQNGAGVDDDQDEDPEEIEPMTDDEE
ncbi:hypothetical protein GUJ93_ZPchr0002g24618 [Zizania palustris]|uniref:Uncharacterized protein n=1 Tax=Zizania palustris TaxID=103762 RepID=A0A8J5RHP5_ZIZPA|nr:hypothetical protein GUJ93_ZPchr0002g24618 [Zizania palustris]